MTRDEYLFKRLKEHLNYLKENYPQYNVIYIGLQGSQNYDLDIYSEEYSSDVDTKAIIVPSLKEVSLNKQPVSTTIILPNNEHIDVKDIRLMMDNFRKQNINFIEILFTKYRIIESKYKDIMMELINMNEEVAHLNENQALRCIAGMSMEKKKALCHPYPTLIDKIEKYGYDGKQLHHIIRMNDFIKAYTSGKTYKECLTTYSDKEFLMKAKLSKFTLEEALEIANKYDEDTKNIKDKFIKEIDETDEINQDTYEKMKNIQYKIIKRSIELELNPIQSQKKEIDLSDPNNYKNVFVTSDLHFFHDNILKFEPKRLTLLSETISEYINRRIKENKELNIDSNFDEIYDSYYLEHIDEHNASIVKRWNKTVGKNDLVYILGDLALKAPILKLNKLISLMNGNKVLIIGNHDNYLLQNKNFDKSLFVQITPYKEIKYKNKFIVMCHFPIQSFNKKEHGGMHLYGHIHSNKLEHEIKHAYNVGLDVNNYKPVKIDEFINFDNQLCNLDNTRMNEI